MKFKHLLALAALAVCGSSWAAPTDYLSGWTEVTSLPTDNAELSKYYYVFVEGDMMIGQDKVTINGVESQEDQLTAMYMTPEDPKTNNKLVWTLDYNSTWEYGIRSLAHQGHYMQSRGNWPWRLQAAWETGQSKWTHMVFAYADGTWTIQNKGWLDDTTKDYGSNFWGSWYGTDNANRYANGYPLAGNKDENLKGKFKIYSLPRCLYTDMTPGKDMTDCISNNSFELDWAGWTNTGMAIQNNTSFGKTGSKYAEKWEPNGTFGVERTISNLPAGLYKITVHSKARGVSSAYLYANDNQKQITIADNEFDVDVYEKLNSAGSITIGAKAVGTGVGASWFCLDNFTLTYVDADFPEVETVSGLLYNKELETAQNTAKTTYEANNTVANYDAFVAAAAAAKAEKDYEEAQAARTTAALTNGTIATDVMDGWRCTNAQAFHVNTWSTEGATDGSNMTTPFIENWTNAGGLLGNGEVSYLMVGLTPGATYSFSALGRAIIENKNETLHGITMFANEAEVDLTTQGTANYDGKNSLVYGTFTLTGTVNSDGVLAIGFKINDTNCNWLSFKNVKFGELPSDQDKQDLADAIDDADGKTYGFQDGEYAPNVNAAAIAALEAAKAVDVEHAMKAEIVNATNALTNAVWTVNVGEVNAVANGDFEGNYTELAGSGVTSDRAIYVPEGWTINYTNREVNDMTSLNQTTKQYNNFETLPQPSNGGNNTYWERIRWSANGSIVLSQNVNLPAGTYTLSADAYINGKTANAKISVAGKEVAVTETSWKKYEILFTLAEAQNVTVAFSFVQGGAAADSRVGFDNFVLKTTKVGDGVIARATATDGYGTICLPYAATVTGATVYSAAIEGDVVKLNEVRTNLVAGTPYIYKATDDEQTFAYASGNVVAAPVAAGPLVGAFALAEVAAEAGNYMLQLHEGNYGFYLVDKTAHIGANRCYIHVDPATPVKAFFFNDVETAISEIATEANNETIYDLSGRKVAKAQKGLYIINGKKVIR